MTPPHAPPRPDRLGIYRARDSWMVSYVLSTQSTTIRELFNTTELPLPFTASADEAAVRATLAKQEPDAEIYRVQDQR
jgi:hypothetical protein